MRGGRRPGAVSCCMIGEAPPGGGGESFAPFRITLRQARSWRGETAMTDRANDSVRNELQAAYARAGEAWRDKDAAALMRMVTPDFTQRMPDGQIIPYAMAEAGLR